MKREDQGTEKKAKEQQCEDSENVAPCKPRREDSEETNVTDTLTLDFQPPEL